MLNEQDKKQKLLDSLFTHCAVITSTSPEILKNVLSDLNLYPAESKKEKALEVIRQYKATRKDLEGTINMLYDILYHTTTPTPDNKYDV